MAIPRCEYHSDFARKHFLEGWVEGWVEGWAEALLDLLRHKGFVIDDAVQARVAACHDAAQLDAWVGQVVSATTLDQVFAVPASSG